MYFTLKNSTLKILKILGIFRLFRHLNKHKIPVLCYHGVSIDDEHEFMPANYMTFQTFKSRIHFLQKSGYRIISLQDSLDMIKDKKIEKNCVVLTIDDGFTPIFDELIPFLNKNEIPITAYITSYKSKFEIPIFRLVAQYLFWKSKKNKISLEDLDITTKTGSPVEFKEIRTEDDLWEFIRLCEANCKRKQRQEALAFLAKEFGVELTPDIIKAHSIANLKILKDFAKCETLDIQLHTHTHKTKMKIESFKKDIQKNIDYLREVVSYPLEHFCYPSGQWNEEMIPVLKELNIKSATTCDPGLMDTDTNPYKIPRIIDSESMNELVFYSEISGVSSWLRKLFNK